MEIVMAKEVMKANDLIANHNQELINSQKTFCINVLGSPGSGKTTLLEASLPFLNHSVSSFVIEGDLVTSNDAERIEAMGVPSIQINTQGGCHLDANMVGTVLNSVPLEKVDLLFIENVGNLVCTAGFKLGEHLRIVVLSVTEGDDKIEKYPNMFSRADVIILNKIDLLPYCDFDVDKMKMLLQRINPDAEVHLVSSRSGEGIEQVADYLIAKSGVVVA